MRCKYSEYASGWLDGELNPEQEEFYRKHLEACPVCRFEKAALENVSAVFKALKTESIPAFKGNFILPAEDARRLRLSEIYENIYYKIGLAFAMLAFMLRLEAFEPDLNAVFILYAAIHIYLYVSDLKFEKNFAPSFAQ